MFIAQMGLVVAGVATLVAYVLRNGHQTDS